MLSIIRFTLKYTWPVSLCCIYHVYMITRWICEVNNWIEEYCYQLNRNLINKRALSQRLCRWRQGSSFIFNRAPQAQWPGKSIKLELKGVELMAWVHLQLDLRNNQKNLTDVYKQASPLQNGNQSDHVLFKHLSAFYFSFLLTHSC